MLAVFCLAPCAACLDERSDPGSAGAAAADLFSSWPGDESFRLAAEPSLVAGSDESLPLGSVRGAVFFGDGVAIAHTGAHEVLIVDSAGRLISRRGRRGDGPGEYRFLKGIARHGDGLVTWDENHFRATVLDASGEYVGETGIRWRRGDGRIVGTFGSNALMEFRRMGFPGEGSVGPLEVRQPVTYEIVRLSDGRVVFEDTLPGQEEWAEREVTHDGQSDGGLPVIFGRTARKTGTSSPRVPRPAAGRGGLGRLQRGVGAQEATLDADGVVG